MSKHTPGPWKAENRPGVGWIVRWDNPESQICSLRWIGGPHLPEVDRIVEADARLIAAAPDLFEACKRADDIMEALGVRGIKECLDDFPKQLYFADFWAEAHQKLRTAIQKAEESP